MSTSPSLFSCWEKLALVAALAVFLTGCATQKIDWNARAGNYTLDQAIVEFGPPDKQAKLQDGTNVAEWLTRRGYRYSHPVGGWYGPYSACAPWYYGPWYPTYIDSYSARLLLAADVRPGRQTQGLEEIREVIYRFRRHCQRA